MFLLLFLVYHVQSNFYEALTLPITYYSLAWFDDDHDNDANDKTNLFKLIVFKSLSNDYMLILEPQNIHLFIEDAKVIIYHPVQTVIERNEHYTCPESYEIAYAIDKIPKITCHRQLEYLKRFVYTEKYYVQNFNEMQNPLNVIRNFFITIQKMEGVHRLLQKT